MEKRKQKKTSKDSVYEGWGFFCDDISKIIGEKYIIVYMDFINEVKDFFECLKKKGELDVKCFYRKGMINIQKKEIVEDFINEEF